MNLSDPPFDNPKLFLLYLWKIIDLPTISFDNLLFKISYELFLLPPNKAKEFINSSIEKKMLVTTEQKNLTLSDSLNSEFKNWQTKRKQQILQNINSAKKVHQLKANIEKNKSNNFSGYFKTLLEKETLNRAARVSNDAFNIEVLDFDNGIIKATVSGSKDYSYIIEINKRNKYIKHNCHDFETRRIINKKFCKHLAKLFLLLRDSHKAPTEQLIKILSENVDKWDFHS
ncbi:MAG: hypothetical protein ACFFE4_11385 [Candidatus Thorarchaeota archaeon]